MFSSSNMRDRGHTCDEKNTRMCHELFVGCRREPETNASHRRRDYPRVLLCDATGVVAVLPSLIARVVRSI